MGSDDTSADLFTLPRTGAELQEAVSRARSLVNRRAAFASASALVPVPGLDVAADVGTLMRLIPEINHEFGLTPDQLGKCRASLRVMTYQAIAVSGSALAGKIVTTELACAVLRKAGIQITVKQIARYLPAAGQALSAVISFAALKYICHRHIRDCVGVVEALQTQKLRLRTA